ncbi:DUF883 family protein [Allopusillimonas ginsengisoli]|jgi:ElaB/YqjD/DUF883 family membrane-anchored ribosome-binding protein|uniref:DUF883 family protein n=1 Tax=Allopusillimonas ginsengisoli TaxID=453575 RepID=UPI00197F065B
MDTWFSDRRAMQRSRKRLNNDLKNLMADTEDLLRATASHTGTEVEQGRMRLKRQLEAMREHTDGWRDSAIDTFHEARVGAERQVREHPMVVAGVAAGIAAIVAAIWWSADRRD